MSAFFPPPPPPAPQPSEAETKAAQDAAWVAAQAKIIASAFRTLDAIEATARATNPGYFGAHEAHGSVNDRVRNAVQIYCALISGG